MKLETREQKEEIAKAPKTGEMATKTVTEKIMHDVNIAWGTLDGYAAKFKRGKILKYVISED